MFRVATRAARRRPWGAAALVAAALAALAGAARVLWPPRLVSVAEFPRVRPADLAHLLADISAHTLIPAPWTLEEEAGNYSWWRYAVSYACGAGCEGRARVEAAALGAPGHGQARAHRVLLRRRHCRALPPLAWPELCDEIETEWLVSGAGSDGARLQEEARGRCGPLAALLARCPAAAALRRESAAHLARLRRLLAERAPRRA